MLGHGSRWYHRHLGLVNLCGGKGATLGAVGGWAASLAPSTQCQQHPVRTITDVPTLPSVASVEAEGIDSSGYCTGNMHALHDTSASLLVQPPALAPPQIPPTHHPLLAAWAQSLTALLIQPSTASHTHTHTRLAGASGRLEGPPRETEPQNQCGRTATLVKRHDAFCF